MRILIVDNNLQFSHKMKKFIMTCGKHIITVAGSGREARIKVSTNVYDLIFLDLLVSDLNAINLLKYIKKESKSGDAHVIAMTTFSTVKSCRNCFKAGAYDYWSKPFDLQRIRDEIKCH